MQYLKYAFGICLFAYLFTFVNVDELLSALSEISLIGISSIVLISFVFLLLQALRLHMLIYAYVFDFYETVKLSFISQFFSNFLPGGVAGDFYKINFLRQNKLSVSSGIAKIGIDRFSGLAILLLVSALYFSTQSSSLIEKIKLDVEINYLWAIGLFAIFFLFVLVLKKLNSKFLKVISTIKTDLVQIRKKNLVYFAALCIVVFIIRLVKFQIIFWALGYEFNFFDLILLAFVSQVAGMLPVSIGGLGVVEASLFYGLKLFDISENVAFAFVLLNRFSIWIVSLVGGVYWFGFRKKIIKDKEYDTI